MIVPAFSHRRLVRSVLAFAILLILIALSSSSCSAFVVPRKQQLALTTPSLRSQSLFVKPRPCIDRKATKSSMSRPRKLAAGSSDGDVSDNDTPKTYSSQINSALSLLGKTTSSVVSLTFFAFLAIRRDAYMISFFLGAIGNGILSKVLKKLLNQDRPAELDQSDHISLKPSDGGMPSSHAMSLGFIGTFVTLGVAESMPWLVGVLVAYVLSSLYYRVQSNLHTVEQISVGLVVGVTNGFLWRDLTMGTSSILPSINVMDWVSAHLLPESGVLPPIYLLIPAAVGAVVVGSFERRISRWLKSSKDDDGKEE